VYLTVPAAEVLSLLSRSDAIGQWEPWIASVAERDGQLECVTRTEMPGRGSVRVPEDRVRQLIERWDTDAGIGWRMWYPDAQRPGARRTTFTAQPVTSGTRLRVTVGWEVGSTHPKGFKVRFRGASQRFSFHWKRATSHRGSGALSRDA